MAILEIAEHQQVMKRLSADPSQKRGVGGRRFYNELTHSRMQIINPQTYLIVLKQVYLRFGESAKCGYLYGVQLIIVK